MQACDTAVTLEDRHTKDQQYQQIWNSPQTAEANVWWTAKYRRRWSVNKGEMSDYGTGLVSDCVNLNSGWRTAATGPLVFGHRVLEHNTVTSGRDLMVFVCDMATVERNWRRK